MTAQGNAARRVAKTTAAATVKKAPTSLTSSAGPLKARVRAAVSQLVPTERLQLFYRTVPTPLGPFSLFVDTAGAVRCCHWQRSPTQDAVALAKEQHDVCAALQARWYKKYSVQVAPLLPPSSASLPGETAAALLEQYFNPVTAEAGRPEALEKLLLQVPVVYPPTTAFMATTWDVLRQTVPSGATTSYKELGRRVGGALAKHSGATPAGLLSSSPSPRIIGMAMGANPIPVVVPCHRVLSSSGALRGYGLGLRYKVWLLRHEQAEVPEERLHELESEDAISTAISLR